LNKTTRFHWVEAIDLGTRILRNAGAPEDHARMQATHLVEADLRGRASHGLLRLPRLVERIENGVLAPDTSGTSRWRGTALLEVNGQMGFGPVVAYAALDEVCARARETGVAAAAIHNNNHIGMLALFAETVARNGQAVIALSTSEALVHPWGGRKAMQGTNPIAIGVPANPDPFVLDMATSMVAMGTIHDHANRGRPIPADWALDANGDKTTDPHAAKSGALAPFGEAKGYALGLAFEVLVACLTASALGADVVGTLDSTRPCNKGDVFIVVEPAAASVSGAIAAYLDAVRACAPTDPSRPVAVPGDRALAHRDKAMRDGISIPAEIWATLQALAAPPSSSESPKETR
jgi:LDH2 family malate/lactate/ureidoglycolate dehydrogenase